MIPLRRLTLLAAAPFALAACGGAGTPAALQPSPSTAAPTPAPTTAASQSASAASVAGGLTFTVAPTSKAVVRVNEQLADRTSPSDAVLTSEKVSGTFTLLPDGTFTPDSKIVVDLTALASDNNVRDNFIKRSVLQTSTYPTATFVPTKTSGLALPLAASGDLSFTVVGQMTVHGVTKEMTFVATGKRASDGVQVTANATPAFTFGTFGMSQPRVAVVLSVKDEIRLEVALSATQQR